MTHFFHEKTKKKASVEVERPNDNSITVVIGHTWDSSNWS